MDAGFINEGIRKQFLCIRFRDLTYCISKEMSAGEEMRRADGGKGSKHLLSWPEPT